MHESDAISLHDLPLSENMSNCEIGAMRSVTTSVKRLTQNEFQILLLMQSLQSNIIYLNYVDSLFAIGFINYKKLRFWFQMKQCLKEELTLKNQSIK